MTKLNPLPAMSHEQFLEWLVEALNNLRYDAKFKSDGKMTVVGEFAVPERTIITITIHRQPKEELEIVV